jgi:hypothetical protein
MSNSSNAALYVEGDFDIKNPSQLQLQQMQQDANDISSSGFTSVIQSFIHLNAQGDLIYNDTPMIQGGQPTGDLAPNLAQIFASIKAGGNVSKMLFSIGGGGAFGKPLHSASDTDFHNIQTLLQQYQGNQQNNPFLINLQAAVKLYGIDGIDLDLEALEYSYESFTDTVVELTQWLYGQNLLVTYPPYQDQSFWLSVLEQTLTSGGEQMVAWLNLQLYGGADYSTWVSYLTGQQIGVSDVAGFIIPGYRSTYAFAKGQPCDGGSSPSDVQSAIQGLKQSYTTMHGGFIWEYGDIISCQQYTAAQYADAIQNASSASE